MVVTLLSSLVGRCTEHVLIVVDHFLAFQSCYVENYDGANILAAIKPSHNDDLIFI